MSDIVERLRLREPPIPLMREAADEIERMRALLHSCATIAENPGFIEARDTDWDDGVNYAKRFIAAAIRRALEGK